MTVNETTVNAIDKWLAAHPDPKEGQALFPSLHKGKTPSVPTVTILQKKWCDEVGLRGNFGSHTMRKTWDYWQYQKGTPIPLLMEAYGHATQRETLTTFAFSRMMYRHYLLAWNCNTKLDLEIRAFSFY